ncbi:hypothetical protein TRVA0_032S00980 [Trichomonascus vanleenenianus]|uniref:Tma17p n=1 Tax=Trichomonascus vanleenenianus TaxID=2268995 RepID=UPI003EC97445
MEALFNQRVTLDQFRQAVEDLPVDAVQAEKHRLENSIFHLNRTNNELKEEIEKSEDEEDKSLYRQFIDENEDVIVEHRHKIDILLRRLRDLGVPEDENQLPNGNAENGVFL